MGKARYAYFVQITIYTSAGIECGRRCRKN